MAIEVKEQDVTFLTEYGQAPIAFQVKTRFRVEPIQGGLGGMRLIEEAVTPYRKDYDSIPEEGPSSWLRRWNIANWGVLSALDGERRVGGAVLAWKTADVDMLQGREDLAVLWDLRVHPDYRGRGVGRTLFLHAVDWARERRCRQLRVETQNINVPACRFYARQGCELKSINPYAYGALDEVQLIWQMDLSLPAVP